MNQELRVIIIEDSEFDAVVMANVLEQGGYVLDFERIETAEELKKALSDRSWDLILSQRSPGIENPSGKQIGSSFHHYFRWHWRRRGCRSHEIRRARLSDERAIGPLGGCCRT